MFGCALLLLQLRQQASPPPNPSNQDPLNTIQNRLHYLQREQDTTANTTTNPYTIDQQVMVAILPSSNMLAPMYQGPFTVTTIPNPYHIGIDYYSKNYTYRNLHAHPFLGPTAPAQPSPQVNPTSRSSPTQPESHISDPPPTPIPVNKLTPLPFSPLPSTYRPPPPDFHVPLVDSNLPNLKPPHQLNPHLPPRH